LYILSLFGAEAPSCLTAGFKAQRFYIYQIFKYLNKKYA